MVNGMRAPTKPVGQPDVLWGLPGQGGLLTEWAETVPDLTWPESVRTYGRMRRDARLSAILKAFYLPILRATWQLDPNGASTEATELASADLGLPIKGEKNSPKAATPDGFTWYDHCRLALDHLVYGHMCFEQWFAIRKDGDKRTHLAGVQERQPHTISIIDVGDDGSIRNVYQNTQENPIAPNRLVWYVNEKSGANWAGTSLLRPCYTNWVLKHETLRVHATSQRRWGMGVPNVIAPPGATPGQIEEARRLAAGMRAGDQAGAGLPNGFEFRLTGISGAVPDALGFLRYLNEEMTGSALAQIIELGNTTYGSRAVGETFMDLFMLSLQAVADYIGTTASFGYPNMPGITRSLIEYNWGPGVPVPKITAKDVGERHEVTAEGIAALVTSGTVGPDPSLENYMRNAYGLPDRSTPWQPPPSKAGPGGPAAPGPARPAPGGGGAAQAQPSPPGNTAPRAAAGGRRGMTPVEAASGLDPEGITAELEGARDLLLDQWSPVLAAQRAELAGQVTAAVDGGQIDRLAQMNVATASGADLLYRGMARMANKAAARMIGEAAAQGVTIDPRLVRIDDRRLRLIAAARAAVAGQAVTAAASRRALQVVQASKGSDAAEQVTVTLAGMSHASLADQLLAAMNAAANEGRFAVMDAGPGASYVATEINDINCCQPCRQIDGHQFADLAEAREAYPNGAYVHCAGELRCRGTVLAAWPDLPRPAPAEAAAGWDPDLHPRDEQGRFTVGMHVRVARGYGTGNEGYVTKVTGTGVEVDFGGPHPVPLKSGFVEPTGQPPRHAGPDRTGPRRLTEADARPDMRVRHDPGMGAGTVTKVQRGQGGEPGALVMFDQQARDPAGQGFLPHWVPLSSLTPEEPRPKEAAAEAAADWDEARHPRGGHGEWVSLDYNGMDRLLQSEFRPQQLDADQARHPVSGYMINVGLERRVSRPPAPDGPVPDDSLGPEGPATFDVWDNGTLDDPAMPRRKVRTEPIAHVYRGMSAGEWDQARQRGFIASDERGTISAQEGTNAAADPRDAVSYLPHGPGVLAKIAVRPEDKWFTIGADQYLRTRERIPLDRVEHTVQITRGGKYDSEFTARPTRPLAPAAAAWDPARHPRGWHGRFGHSQGPADSGPGSLRHYLGGEATSQDIEDAGHPDQAVAGFAAKAAPAISQVLGGGREAWDGTVTVYPKDTDPAFVGHLDWAGHMTIQDGYAADLTAALAHPDAPVANPDAFVVTLHELVHGDIGGRSAELRKEYNALPATHRGALAEFDVLDRHSPTPGFPVLHTLDEVHRVAPKVTQDTVDDLTRRGLLEKSSSTVSSYNPHTGESTPPAHQWRLTGRGQALAQAADDTIAAHKEEYQHQQVKEAEEGFTELSTIQHAEELLGRLGVGGRETRILAQAPVTGKPPALRQVLAEQQQIREIYHLEGGLPGAPGGLDTYRALGDAMTEMGSPHPDTAKIAQYLTQALAATPHLEVRSRLAALNTRLGLGGGVVDNPEYARKTAALAAALTAAAERLRDPALPHDQGVAGQAAAALADAAAAVRDGDTSSAADAITALRRTGWDEFRGDAASLTTMLDDTAATPMLRHATLAEYARRLADPARIRSGNSWGHYGDWTARAQQWVQLIARAERRRNLDKAGSAGYQRTVELADQISREAEAAKFDAMARQVIAARGGHPDDWTANDISQLATVIEGRWRDGAEAAYESALNIVKVLGKLRAAADDLGPPELPPVPPMPLTAAGRRAAGIAEWAWEDPQARAVQALAQVGDLARQAGGDPVALRQVRDTGLTLARLASSLDAPPDASAAAGWDPQLHPRGWHGRFGDEAGPGPAAPQRAVADIRGDLEGEAGRADADGDPDVAELLRWASGSLHAGTPHGHGLAVSYVHEAVGRAKDPARASRLRFLYRDLVAAQPEHQIPEGVFQSLAGSVHIEAGVSAAQKQAAADALAHLPAKVRAGLKDGGFVRRVSIRARNWQTQSAEGLIWADGQYDPATRVLTLSAGSRNMAGTSVHEALHAWDRARPSGRGGRFSNQAGFKKLARDIRSGFGPRWVGSHYIPDPGSAPERDREWLTRAGNAEMFSELGSQYLTGAPYSLKYGTEITGSAAADLDGYFAGILGARGQVTAAAPGDSGELPGELACTSVVLPDGSRGVLWTRPDGAIILPPAGPDVEAAWDPELHPRDDRGRFTNRGELLTRHAPPGTRRMAVPPSGVKAGDWLALGKRRGGYRVAAVEPVGEQQPGPVRIHLEGGGRILLGWSYHQPRHGGVPVYRHVKTAEPPPRHPDTGTPGTPEALFTSMAGSYYAEPGVTARQKQKIADALALLPAQVRRDISDAALMSRISLRRHHWQDEAPEGTVTAIGSYNPGTRALTIAADAEDVGDTPDLGQVVNHETLHAWDRLPSGRTGRFSWQEDFQALGTEIRDAEQRNPGLVDPHFAPYGGPRYLAKAGDAELFAELGADYLARMPYNLSSSGRGTHRRELPPQITEKLDRYFAGVFFGGASKPPARRKVAAAAAAEDGLICVRIIGADGTPGWQFIDGDGQEINPATGERTGPVRGFDPPEPPGGDTSTASDPAGPAGGEPWTMTGAMPDGQHVTLSWDGGLSGWPDDALGWLLDGVAAGEVQGDDGPAVREWLQVRGFTATTHAAAGLEAGGGTQAAAGQGTTGEQAAGAITYAGDAAAHEVYERLHAAYPGGYRHAVNEDAPGHDAYIGPAFLRTPMRQPYPERVDGLRAEIRNGRDIGPSLAVVHRGVHVLIDGTHHAVARVLEGHKNIPLRVLELPAGRAPAPPDADDPPGAPESGDGPAAAFRPDQPRDPRTGKWVAEPGAGSVRAQLAQALGAEQDDAGRAGLPDIADRLGTAAQMVTERRGYPASHLRDTASQARRSGHPDRAGRYEDLARQILAIPGDQATPAPATAEPAAPRQPELSGAALWQSPEGRAQPTGAEAAAAERVWYSRKAEQTAAYLRGSRGKPPPGQQGADITAFIGLIRHSAPFTQPAVMWRGTYGGDRLFGPPGSAKGKRFADDAPVSATASEDTAMSYGDTLIRVHIPPGAHALRADEGIWAAADGGTANTDYPVATVQEYTLLPGSAFEVTGDGTVSSFYGRRRVLDVNLLPEGTPAPPAAPMAAAGSSGPDLAGLPGGDRFAWRAGQVRFGDPADAASSPQAAFNPAERRDAHGRWRPWTDAARSRNPRFYHGTTTDLEDTAGREGQYTYFTPSFYQASTFARRHARLAGGTPRVYPVEPAGKYGDDPLSYQGLRTRAPLRITGPAYATPSTAEMSQLARTYQTPEVQHGPLYIGRDKDYERDRDAWEASVAAAFNPAEMRDREGKWTSTGGPKVAGLAPAGRYTMRGLPAGHPLRATLDARLTTAQHRRGKPAELTRPALPPYEEAVARTAAAIVREIKTQDTLEEGRGWYPHEHQLAEQRAQAYGVPVQVAAAVEAATSPRVHWDINQRVTNEILDEIPKAGQPAADIIAAHRLGGGIMWKFRDDATVITLGGDIGEHLHGAKVRSYYSNIMWPGRTDQVTVDTWMNQALVSGLGITTAQAAALAGEHPKEFPEGIGRMLAADATRAAAEQLTADGTPAAPDQVQAAYWLAAQAAAGAKPAALWAAAPGDAGDNSQLEDLDDDRWDAELLLGDLAWLAADIPGRIDLGPPGSARPQGGYAAANPAAWAIAAADPRFAALGLTRAQAAQAALRQPP